MNFFRRRYYRALLSEPDLVDDDSDSESGPPPSAKCSMSWLSRIAGFLAITCTIFNLIHLVYTSMQPMLHREPPLASLPRPNQFIGLERINHTKYPFPNVHIATFASVVAQVDRTRPKYVFPTDPSRDHNVLATNQISTIMQFRARDFGMEWCKFKLALPDSSQYHRSSHSSEHALRERSWLLEGDTTDLEVWELEASQWIDPSRLSYKSRPKRKSHTFSFRVQPNKTLESREFRCPADQIVTFEIFCVSPGCMLDIWQNKLLPPVGLYLEQRSSL